MTTRSSFKPVVVLPTYNERPNIEPIVRAILDVVPVDIWIVDDNSPDGTGKFAQRIADTNKRVHVLHRQTKDGLGKAYIAGFKKVLEAGYSHVLQMDADFSHPLHKLPVLLELSNQYDVVLGSRWIKGGKTENWPLRRKLLSWWGSFYARSWLRIPIQDLTGGFKCFRREVLQAIDLNAIETTGYAFQIEMTYRAHKKGFSITETPIVFSERNQGTSKMSKKIAMEAIVAVPKLRFKLGD